MKENKISIWYRKGATQDISKEEYMTLLDYCCPGGIIDKDKYDFSEKTVAEILKEFDSDGDFYIPSEVMEDLAKENGIELHKGCFNV